MYLEYFQGLGFHNHKIQILVVKVKTKDSIEILNSYYQTYLIQKTAFVAFPALFKSETLSPIFNSVSVTK